jgi:photosystem II stability/assembly factor-like uncharacterized protein
MRRITALIAAVLLFSVLAAHAAPSGQAPSSSKSRAAANKPKDAKSAAAPDKPAPDPYRGLELRNIGPAMTSGRIADIAIHPRNHNTWYVAAGSGGVWKTVNGGTTWSPIFEKETSYSIGCVTLDPVHPEVVWVGTGENVGGRHVGFGDGVYKSVDGGASWKKMGLDHSEHIGRIVVDPRNPDVVYVAAQGPLWSSGGDRGLFKTTDGGATWQNLLSGGPYTGVNDVVMDPRDSNVLYAATHQRLRTVAALIDGGPESAIQKSTDGGRTWRKLTRGLPEEQMGRIGLAISPQNPDVVYATIELAHRRGGFYRSADGGGSWEKRSDAIAGGTGPHYYQEIFPSPHQFDRVYQCDVRLQVTEDGGRTFRDIEGRFKHVDNHAVAFDPSDPDFLLVGCDGGLYQSRDLGATWSFVADLPVTQFYKLAVDNAAPFYNVYGGAQDNNTLGGPTRTDNAHGILNSDWFVTNGGDGYMPAADPTNPDIAYGELQNGNMVRFDRKTGEGVFIQPQPGKDDPTERFNWDAPIVVSPHDPATLYFASQRVWRSDDRGDSWKPISGDLSRGLDRMQLPMMGHQWGFDALWDLFAMSRYGAVTALSQSPLDANLLYAGTDDGLIQITEDGGAHWRRVDKLPGVPDFFFVNDIKADLHDKNTVYIAVDRHKSGDFAPYLLKSTDRGKSWKSLAGGLPARHIVWRIVQDHVKPDLLFAGTEFGLFFTVDGGTTWTQLKGGVPTIAFRDVVIQRRENDLVAGSFGRGIFILDDYSALRQVSPQMLAGESELFPVRKALWYVERRVMGGGGKAFQGDAFFTAPNPPFGAVFTYYLRDNLETRAAARRTKEKKIARDGGDTPFPSWDALREEALEEDPAVVLTVRDSAGAVVRRLTGPAKAGFQRVAWDLRYPSVQPETGRRGGGGEEGFRDLRGPLAPPGTYTVSLAKRQNGKLTDLGKSQRFEVVRMRQGALPGAPDDRIAAFAREISDFDRTLQGATTAMDEAGVRIRAIKSALMRSTVGDASLDDQARTLERRLADLRFHMTGDTLRDEFNEPGPLSLADRFRAISRSAGTTYGPTPNQLASFDVVKEQFAALRRDFDQLVGADLPALEAKLGPAGVPWTPGRGAQ